MSYSEDTPSAERTGSRLAGGEVDAVAMRQVALADWEPLVAAFDDVAIEQLPSFAGHRWPDAGIELQAFHRGGEIVGGCLVIVRRLPLGAGAVAVTKWGPMLAHAGRSDAMVLYAQMIERLVEHYGAARRMTLSVMAHALPMQGNPHYEHLMARGFEKGAQFAYPNRYIVRLLPEEAEQRRTLEQKWRYNLNRSEKEGLSFEHAGPERFGEFDALYRSMTDRKRFHDYSAYDTLPALLTMDEARLRPELFIVRKGGEAVAGIVIFKAGKRAVYLYGATSERALGLRAGYFMQWQVLRWLRENSGASWYDLGGTDGFQGLHQFKKGLVGSAGVIAPLPPAANIACHPVPRLVGQTAFAARELLHLGLRIADRLRPGLAQPDQGRERRR